MRPTRAAERSGAAIAARDQVLGTRRATYCDSYSVISFTCRRTGRPCTDASGCPDYEDAVEAHRRRLRGTGRLIEVRT